MSVPSDPLSRQLAILAKLEGRAIAPASEYFARQVASNGPATPELKRRSRFAQLFPQAECLEHAGSVCWRVTVWAPLSGERTAQGYACPVLPYSTVPPSPVQLALIAGDAAWQGLDFSHILYLDTETTSLSGGTGTYTFLIGLGRFAPNAAGEQGFEVTQYFMEDYDGEAALVHFVDEAMQQSQALVSYNGRSYDVPLLESRWAMQSRRPCFPALHLDLLHYARKLWKLRLPGCGLGNVEAGILNLRRLSDVDGSWVPRIYFDFVHGIRAERIVPVFDHHAQDIFSMGALVAVLARALQQPGHADHAHASDQWGLSRIFSARGETERGLACLEAAVLAARDEDLGFRLAMHLARTYRKLGRVEEATAIWQARVAQARAGRLDPLIELAKHAEHAQKDFAAAREWVRRALEMAGRRQELAKLIGDVERSETSGARELAALNQRLARLLQREERAQAKAAKQAARTGRFKNKELSK